jgi:hypothetical protein
LSAFGAIKPITEEMLDRRWYSDCDAHHKNDSADKRQQDRANQFLEDCAVLSLFDLGHRR